MIAEPGGAQVLRESALRTHVAARLALLQEAGLRDAKALQIDPLPLSTDYALVRLRWSLWLAPPDRTDVVEEFLVDDIVRLHPERITIVATFTHDSEAEIRKRLGLALRR